MSDLPLAPTADLVDAARSGRMFVLFDAADDRGGALVCAAAGASAAAINFMAMHARGLVRLALTETQARKLSLAPMAGRFDSPRRNAMMASIEAREGVTTGISAADRAWTIAVAAHPDSRADDIVSPGHVFPIMARDEGVLATTEFAEAAIEVARLAGLEPAAVLCDILNEDGRLAQAHELIAFAQVHGLAIGSLQDLVRHVHHGLPPLRRLSRTPFVSRHGGDWTCTTFENPVGGAEHLVLVHGDPAGMAGPAPVYLHRLSLTSDLLGEAGPRGDQLHAAMAQIGEAGGGVILLFGTIRDPAQAATTAILSDADVATKILTDMGLSRIIQLHPADALPQTFVSFGLTVIDRRPIHMPSTNPAIPVVRPVPLAGLAPPLTA